MLYLGIIIRLHHVPSHSLEGSIFGLNPRLVYLHDVSSVGPDTSPVKGYMSGHHPPSRYRGPS
jgi:hypothetical protein